MGTSSVGRENPRVRHSDVPRLQQRVVLLLNQKPVQVERGLRWEC